jgi:hypothetical protein
VTTIVVTMRARIAVIDVVITHSSPQQPKARDRMGRGDSGVRFGELGGSRWAV